MDDVSPYIEIQAEASKVARAFGMEAPPPLPGESLRDYRVRSVSYFKQYSPEWRDTNLGNLAASSPAAFGVAQSTIYKDAYHVATHPSCEPGDPQTSRTYTDEAGRRVTDFFGDPMHFIRQFSGPGVRYLVGVSRHPRGA
jgi:hypothetical protein